MKKIRLATGIYRDTFGIEARVQVGREIRSTRFPHDADLGEDARLATGHPRRSTECGATDRPAVRRVRYARRRHRPLPGADRRAARASRPIARICAPGFHSVGQKSRRRITTEDIDLAIAGWRKTGPKNAVRRIRVQRTHATSRRLRPTIARHRSGAVMPSRFVRFGIAAAYSPTCITPSTARSIRRPSMTPTCHRPRRRSRSASTCRPFAPSR